MVSTSGVVVRECAVVRVCANVRRRTYGGWHGGGVVRAQNVMEFLCLIKTLQVLIRRWTAPMAEERSLLGPAQIVKACLVVFAEARDRYRACVNIHCLSVAVMQQRSLPKSVEIQLQFLVVHNQTTFLESSAAFSLMKVEVGGGVDEHVYPGGVFLDVCGWRLHPYDYNGFGPYPCVHAGVQRARDLLDVKLWKCP